MWLGLAWIRSRVMVLMGESLGEIRDVYWLPFKWDLNVGTKEIKFGRFSIFGFENL